MVFYIAFVMMTMQPLAAHPAAMEADSLVLIANGNSIKVQNATIGSVLEVYSILGLKVYSLKLDAAEKSLTLNLSKGWYLVKLEGVVRKIAIK